MAPKKDVDNSMSTQELVKQLSRVWAFHITTAEKVDYAVGDVSECPVQKALILKNKDLLRETRDVQKYMS
eukprot:9284670-Pyramimonas_sp.AAC.1